MYFRKIISHAIFDIIFLLSLSTVVNSLRFPKIFHQHITRAEELEARDGCGNYICYYGSSKNFPGPSQWLSFEQMFSLNINNIRNSCRNLEIQSDNVSNAQIKMIHDAIVDEANYSSVDSRWIMAIMMQESVGCPGVGATANPVAGSPSNPGLMQSAGGASFAGNGASPAQQESSIRQMIEDGVRGTARGWGLLQWLNQRGGNFYEAARMYNSGYSGSFTNLNAGGVGTAAYVCDIANRLTGPYVDSHFSKC